MVALGAERVDGKETHHTGKLIRDDFESKSIPNAQMSTYISDAAQI